MKSSRHSGNNVHCPRSASSTKRLINSPAESRGNHSSSKQRFHTARVNHGLLHRSKPCRHSITSLGEQQLRHFETERKGIDALAPGFVFDATASAFRRS
jgi:hypothetical protein